MNRACFVCQLLETETPQGLKPIKIPNQHGTLEEVHVCVEGECEKLLTKDAEWSLKKQREQEGQ